MTVRVPYDDLDIDWWAERDRASVVLYDSEDRDNVLFEAWDEDVHELIEDGFIKWEDDDSVIEYAEYLGLIEDWPFERDEE